MAEARSEEEEENMRRDTGEQVVRRPPSGSGGRPDRRKPEHRHSQGPLSSIRAAIKRTSNRSVSLSESSREGDRDRDRDRRRPEITILSAEPLGSTSWFPGASGGFPPPPPPAAQIWGPTIPSSIQPPPSYEEVIREKTQEQVLFPSSSTSSSHPASTTTIATQTDPGSDPPVSQVKRPVRPARPPLDYPSKLSHVDEITSTTSESGFTSLDRDCAVSNKHPECPNPSPEHRFPSTSNAGDQIDQQDKSFAAVDQATPPVVPLNRPRPRPRSRLSVQPISTEVKVQTLVKLRDDGLATLAARSATETAKQEVSQGKYLTELLEAFSADGWGFPDRRSDSSEYSQSESEEGDDDDDMATLKTRIQAIEQQSVADGSCGENRDTVGTKKPEPRPRPRLQGQPAKSVPPAVAPKPKNFSHAPKLSNKKIWEDDVLTAATTHACRPDDLKTTDTANEPQLSLSTKLASVLVTPKPDTETLPSSTSAPVPAPRPNPPKVTSVTETVSLVNPKPPPRPLVAPRASLGANGNITPSLPPRPSSGVQTEGGSDKMKDPANITGKTGSGRPSLPTKPAALTSARRASAPNLTPKPPGGSLDLNSAALKPPGPAPRLKAPAPVLRKGSESQPKPEATNTTNSSDPPLPPRPSDVKLLPLRPPPIKSCPGRPPPPSVSSSLANSVTTPPTQTCSTSTVSCPNQPSLQTTSSVSTQRAAKKGPPLPPRPKPGHPLFNNYMKQEVLIILDDPRPTEILSGDGRSQTSVTPQINQSQCLLDLSIQPEPVPDGDSQSKPALESLSLSDSESILPVQPAEQKEDPDLPPVSGPRCVALFDYEGEEDEELTFSQGDVIALLEHIGQEWGRGQIHGRVGIFPLNFTKMVEPLPQSSAGEVPNLMESTDSKASQEPDSDAQEWAVALFDFPGQTAEDLSFHKGAIIQVTEHIDAEWRRGSLEGREGLYPAAFTQTYHAQPIPGQHSVVKGVARFAFTAESEDELTVKVGDIITQVESVDEQWIMGVVGRKRGIVPKGYISLQ